MKFILKNKLYTKNDLLKYVEHNKKNYCNWKIINDGFPTSIVSFYNIKELEITKIQFLFDDLDIHFNMGKMPTDLKNLYSWIKEAKNKNKDYLNYENLSPKWIEKEQIRLMGSF